MTDEKVVVQQPHPADTNGDGKVSKDEHDSLYGMLLYPFLVIVTNLLGFESAGKILGDMAGVYFIAVAGIVAAFFGAQAMTNKKKK